MNAMQTANDNTSAVIKTVGIFALGRSGRRVAPSRGVSFGIELEWSNGTVTVMASRFPAYLAAVTHAARVYGVADKAGMVAA